MLINISISIMNILIVILILVAFLVLLKKQNNSTPVSKKNKFVYTNNGFANIKSSYTMPIVYDNLVTPQEAEHIITTAKGSFKESTIIGGFDTSIRKSKTTWLYLDDPVVKGIIQRICDMTGYPIENTEALQVVQYEPGGFYKEHHDACCDDDQRCTEFVQNGGQRILTALIYLNDSFTGGATSFPELKRDIKPPKYGGVIFRPLENDSNKCHPLALHKGTPVESGIKYVCNIWIREGRYK